MTFTKKVSAGQDISSADFRQYFGDFFSEGVKTGFTVSDAGGLDVAIAAGTAYVKDASGGMFQVVSSGSESLTLTDDSTNYIFLRCDNGATYLTSSTSATVPDDGISLATVVCASADISSITSTIVGLPGTMPSGGIIIWTGTLANIPSGWLLCDGENSTPNLIDRFLQGVSTSATNPGRTGGSHTKSCASGWTPAGETYRGATTSLDIRPKYYEVAFIMKS